MQTYAQCALPELGTSQTATEHSILYRALSVATSTWHHTTCRLHAAHVACAHSRFWAPNLSLPIPLLQANGTTTATYFGSLHLAPNKVLVDTIIAYGQRAVVGKVNMDRESPDTYMEPTDQVRAHGASMQGVSAGSHVCMRRMLLGQQLAAVV